VTKTKKGRLGWKELLLSLFLMVVVWASGDLFFGGGEDPRIVETEGSVQVMFTSPHARGAAEDAGGLDLILAEAIDSAQERVDIAAYDFDLLLVAEALVNAQERGLDIRLVTDSDYVDEAGTALVQQAGIPVVGDERDPLMHDKFVVIDERWVWTGSWNLTENGTYRNNNNAVRIDSPALAQNYSVEFEEMFADRQFGPRSPAETPHVEVEIGETLVETYFSPEDDAQDRIVELLEGAENNIRFLAFVFTDNEMTQVLSQQHEAGVTVQGIVESRNVNDPGSDVDILQMVGIDVRLDGNPYNMHHKVMIIDDAIVITGSYNFSRSAADYNDENVLILHSPEIAAHYLDEFERLYSEAEEMNP
jgi:phosphatidylserine/phosphatidylglycerophosphate/cardiolipin synthase-like enzyme